MGGWGSYLKIGMSYGFSESDDTDSDQWQQGFDSLDYPPTARMLKSVAFFRQDGTAIQIKWKDIAYIRRYPTQSLSGQQNVGPPAIIAPLNLKIFIRPLCDQQVYNVIIDF